MLVATFLTHIWSDFGLSVVALPHGDLEQGKIEVAGQDIHYSFLSRLDRLSHTVVLFSPVMDRECIIFPKRLDTNRFSDGYTGDEQFVA